jgi:hypothetical protein
MLHVQPIRTFSIVQIEEAYKITKCLIIIWHVDPLLGNDSEVSSYPTAFAKCS